MKNKEFGNFITYDLWKDALKLINYEISLKDSNYHFATLSNLIYKANYDISEERFFKHYISTNLFYLFDDIFYFSKYFIPKNNIGKRPYLFFSLPMKALFYAVGLYIFQLSNKFLKEYRLFSKNNVFSFYGGEILYDNKTLIYKDKIYYREYYLKFIKQITKAIHSQKFNFAIRLDIERFFENISIQNLLNKIYEYTEYDIKYDKKFNSYSIESICDFFDYINCGEIKGIPQSDNNIISNLISDIYIKFLDLDINEILKNHSNITNFTINRYVDDIYIFLDLKNGNKEFCLELINVFSDLLLDKHNLKFNNKISIIDLSIENDIENLKKNLKFNSLNDNFYFDDFINEDNSNENSVQKNFLLLQNELKKFRTIDNIINNNIDSHNLNLVYEDKIKNYLNKKENLEIINNIINSININLLKFAPKSTIILFMLYCNKSHDIEKYIKSLNTINILEKKLIREFYIQCKINDIILDEEILEFIKPHIKFQKTYEISDYIYPLIVNNEEKISIIEQIRLMKISEYSNKFSLALNHLSNIINEIVFFIDNMGIEKKYFTGNNIKKCLIDLGIPYNLILNMNILFNRRNNNEISHSSTKSNYVTKSEYISLKNNFKNLIKEIKNKV